LANKYLIDFRLWFSASKQILSHHVAMSYTFTHTTSHTCIATHCHNQSHLIQLLKCTRVFLMSTHRAGNDNYWPEYNNIKFCYALKSHLITFKVVLTIGRK